MRVDLCLMHANREELESEHCMWRAAENGVPEAQFWIGVAYDQQLWFGITDKQEAFKWVKRAAKLGYVDAEAELGRCYEDGDGVERDYALAAHWYRRFCGFFTISETAQLENTGK
jgi:Sel1 repeat